MSRRILLTGATGALGPHLAAELLASGAAERIDVLIRPGAEMSARDRFDTWSRTVAKILLADHGVASASILRRLSLVPGDMRVDGLGIGRVLDDELTCDTEVILHAAADTRFRDCPQAQWDINVEGTRRMLDLARRCCALRKFIFVSTTCVSGNRTGVISETLSAEPPVFLNHYERTKWEAERLVLASNLPTQVARVSIVMGSETTGFVHRPGALHRVLRWFGRGLIPLVPGTADTTVDLISTETAARCLARAVSTESAAAVWHIAAGDRAVPLPDLMTFVWDYFAAHDPAPRRQRRRRVPVIVDRDRFERFRRSIDPARHAILSQVMESVESFLPGLLRHPKTFDTTEAQRLWGGALPIADWRQTLARVMRANCIRQVKHVPRETLPCLSS